MTNKYQLIQLYCVICHQYNNILVADAQRTSNNFLPKFSDEECITIVLWGLANRKHTYRDVHKFIKDYYGDWFPLMPKYKAFNKRVCYLADAIKTLASVLLTLLVGDPSHNTHLADSVPIVVAKQSRSGRGKVAPDMCDKGYCDSKKMFYYGIKLHFLCQSRYKTIPQPKQVLLTKASVHDGKAAKEIFADVHGIELFGDKAYIDAEWIAQIETSNNIRVITPVKLKKGQHCLDAASKLFSAGVSNVRQPIESFFNWLNELTNIQQASKVRSSNGLISFVFARISLACLVLANLLLF